MTIGRAPGESDYVKTELRWALFRELFWVKTRREKTSLIPINPFLKMVTNTSIHLGKEDY